MARSKSLKTAVSKEVDEAADKASTGNVKTTKAPTPAPDLPTGQRRSLPPQ